MYGQIIVKHYQRILASWPVDILRPEVSFQKAIQHRINIGLGTSKSSSEQDVTGNEAQVMAASPKPYSEQTELEQVNALYSLVENKFMKKVSMLDKH